jgi:hypothetical protein
MVEKHWGNDRWTNQRYWQDWACKTQDEQNTTQKPKKMNNTDPIKNRVVGRGL